MKPGFSEFSYGYAVTEELAFALRSAIVGAPVFPSLYEEGKDGGGYDMKLPIRGKPIFLQFKISHCMRTANAREHAEGLMNVPYFRMYLHAPKHSRQHRMLLRLDRSGESVFYIAPEFHEATDLNKCYLGKTVIINSAAFAPRDVGELPDDNEHYIAFAKETSCGYLRSESRREVKRTSLRNGLLPFLLARDIPTTRIDEPTLVQMREKLFSIVSETYGDGAGELGQIRALRSPIESVGHVARTFFDAQLVIVPEERA